MKYGHNSGDTNFNNLPAAMAEIADIHGLRMVFALVEHFGGVELRIPNKLKKDHKLLALGEDFAQMLCDQHGGGDTILVPVSLSPRSLRTRVLELEKIGMKRWEIARELGITQRHVRRLANQETPKRDGQYDLFSDLEGK